MTMRFLKPGLCFAFRRSASLNMTAACIERPCSGPKAGRLHLRRLGFSMKRADPFSALLNPNASAVVCAGYVLAVGSRLELRLVSHDSHLRMREHHLDV